MPHARGPPSTILSDSHLFFPFFKDESNFRNIVSPNIKSTEVGLFMFVKQQRITLKCLGNMTTGRDVEL